MSIIGGIVFVLIGLAALAWLHMRALKRAFDEGFEAGTFAAAWDCDADAAAARACGLEPLHLTGGIVLEMPTEPTAIRVNG